MKKFVSLFRQDLLVTHRNGFIWVILLLLAVMLALVAFLPESIDSRMAELFYDGSPDNVIQSYLLDRGAGTDQFYDSEAAMLAALAETNKGVGVAFNGDLSQPAFTFTTQGNVAEENLNILAASMESVLADLQGEARPQNYAVTRLRQPREPIPLNLAGVPVFLVFEVVLLGFFIVAVLVFQEKQENTIRAYRVSPAGTAVYILSKNSVFLLLSVLYGVPLVLFSLGFSVNYLNLLALILLSASLMTLIGLFVAVFFRNLSEWFFVGVFVLILNMLPIISYAAPVFAPDFITWIPSYPVLFGVKEILFPTGETGFMQPIVTVLLVENLLALAAAYWAVDRKLMKVG